MPSKVSFKVQMLSPLSPTHATVIAAELCAGARARAAALASAGTAHIAAANMSVVRLL
jgi:hypothetical protein